MPNYYRDSELEFSNKYDAKHAKQYFFKHDDGFWRQLSNWREHQVAQKALKLAGSPKSVLDMPCGTGRFWQLLAADLDRTIYAVDYSQNMINMGLQHRPKDTVQRIQVRQGSAFDLPFANDFVETVFCIRFIHHLGESQDRLKLLRELERVSRSSVIISLWVDGNYKARRRKNLEARRSKNGYQNRFVVSAEKFEAEAQQTGFTIKGYIDFLPRISMWRTYVLEKSNKSV